MMWLAVALLPLTVAFPPGGPPFGGPGGPGGPRGPPGGGMPQLPRELPPGFEAVLPAETVQQLKAIHEDDNMPPQQKHEKIDEIMKNLPAEVQDRLPEPPGFDRVPDVVKDSLKQINRDKSLNWRSRMDKIREFISSLPEETKRLLPPMGPPPPPRAFQQMPQEVKDKLKSIQANKSLGHKERYHQITEVMDALPETLRSQLPLAPPAPSFA